MRNSLFDLRQLTRCAIKPQLYALRLLTLTGLIASSLALSTTSYAALSASTVNTIEGSEPYFLLSDGATKLTSTDELLGFTIKDTGGNIVAQIKASDAGTAIAIPKGIKLDGIKAILTPNTTTGAAGFRPLSAAVTSNDLVVADGDGDASIATNTSALGKIRVNLKQNGVAVTPSTITFNTCDNYSLDIAIDVSAGADKITALTTYGDPNKKEYTGTTTSVTYTLKPQGSEICRIEPSEKTVYTPVAGQGGGNASAEWITGKGFSVPALKAAGKPYPLTGFRNAKLNLMGSGTTQVNYTCKLATASDSTYIKLSATAATAALGKGCGLTYTGTKIPHAIVIDMYDNATPTTPIDSYTIPQSTLWADGAGSATTSSLIYNDNTSYDYSGKYVAANYCIKLLTGVQGTLAGVANHKVASQYFFKRSELTNNPEASAGYWYVDSSNVWQQVGTSAIGGRYIRAADGTFTGEWGYLYSYTNSPWSTGSGYYWTAESYTSYAQYTITSYGLMQGYYPTDTNIVTVCKR